MASPIDELSDSAQSDPAKQFRTLKYPSNLEQKPDLALSDKNDDTPMVVAVKRGDPRFIKSLWNNGARIDDKKQGYNLIHLAIIHGRYSALSFLIKRGVDFKDGQRRDDGDRYPPPLVVAASEGFPECVRILLQHIANHPNVDYKTEAALYSAVAGRYTDIVRLLLEHKPQPAVNVVPDGQDMLLTRAVCTGDTEIVSLLIEHGAEVDRVDPNGSFANTPLSRACSRGDLDMVKLLLEKKADINYTGGKSDAPLFTALWEGKSEVAEYLLKLEDVDVMWKSFDGMGSLHAASHYAKAIPKLLQRGIPIDDQCDFGTAMHIAAREGLSEAIQSFVDAKPKPDLDCAYGGGHGPLEDEIGYTVLQLACRYLNLKPVEILLKADADPTFRNKNGDDALDIFLRTKKVSKDAEDILKLLLSKSSGKSVCGTTKENQTRLHSIHETTTPVIVKRLVEAKVPLDRRDKKGYTPLAVAISKGNEDVSRYLIKQGVNVNVFSPEFGSILHIAILNGALNLVKLLVDSGADLEVVDVEYNESLLYTALSSSGLPETSKMVRYLVDVAKVPINKFGGRFGYPIIRVANLTEYNTVTYTEILEFFIDRKAQLNVADSQGRRAVHLACRSASTIGIEALFKAEAEFGVKDKFGRMPIHFAASSSNKKCIVYLLDNKLGGDINVADHDGWTPLLWAVRSGADETVVELLNRNADIWIRSHASNSGAEWSALKLANFAKRSPELKSGLQPKEPLRVNSNGQKEEWDSEFHKYRPGYRKNNHFCDCCLMIHLGLRWVCIECTVGFSLCFKCYRYLSDVHDRRHTFGEIGSIYHKEDELSASSTSSEVSVKEVEEA